MSAWLFNADESYLLSKMVPTFLGKEEDWHMSQLWNEVKVGEKLIFWQAGPNAGIYALGEVAKKPKLTNEIESDWQVAIKYEPLLKNPILKRELVKHKMLADLLIIRMPHGKNPTRITDDQWQALEEMLRR